MIFDDSQEELQILHSQKGLENNKGAFTSLDNFLEQRQNEIVKQNLDNIYCLYKIEINKEFFAWDFNENAKENANQNRTLPSTQEDSCL